MIVRQPLELTNMAQTFDIKVNVFGGGESPARPAPSATASRARSSSTTRPSSRRCPRPGSSRATRARSSARRSVCTRRAAASSTRSAKAGEAAPERRQEPPSGRLFRSAAGRANGSGIREESADDRRWASSAAPGYTGVELLRLLAAHPDVRDCAPSPPAARRGRAWTASSRRCGGAYDLAFTDPAHGRPHRVATACSSPPPTASRWGRPARSSTRASRSSTSRPTSGIQDIATWERWYKHEARGARPSWPRRRTACRRSTAGRSAARASSPIPGCYATAVQLALLPLVETDFVDTTRHFVADCEIGRERRRPQGRGRHPLLRGLRQLQGLRTRRPPPPPRGRPEPPRRGRAVASPGLTFVPHLVPMIRGILATDLRADPQGGGLPARSTSERYAGEAFVDVLAARHAARDPLGARHQPLPPRGPPPPRRRHAGRSSRSRTTS
jgi:N-acetyl-gamma-glutamyl-phosphate reductase